MYDSVISLIKDSATPAVALLTVIYDEYGPECFDWEPEVLRLEILQDFGVEPCTIVSDKMQAAITIMSSDHFEHDWHSFNSCIHALNGEPFSSDEFYPIDAEQIVAAMPEIEMLRNNFLGEGVRFSDEVNAYAGFIFSEYGLFFAPDEFPTALMPVLQGEYPADTQIEKREALADIYAAKKTKIVESMDCVRHVFTV